MSSALSPTSSLSGPSGESMEPSSFRLCSRRRLGMLNTVAGSDSPAEPDPKLQFGKKITTLYSVHSSNDRGPHSSNGLKYGHDRRTYHSTPFLRASDTRRHAGRCAGDDNQGHQAIAESARARGCGRGDGGDVSVLISIVVTRAHSRSSSSPPASSSDSTAAGILRLPPPLRSRSTSTTPPAAAGPALPAQRHAHRPLPRGSPGERHCPPHPPHPLLPTHRPRIHRLTRRTPPPPPCRVPPPPEYRLPMTWPARRERVWHGNVELPILSSAELAGGDLDPVRARREWLVFPKGVGTYVEQLESMVPLRGGDVRTALDVGCCELWGYLLHYGILTMSIDRRNKQVQLALERGLPAMIGVLGAHRLPYPSRSFDMVHCAGCLVPGLLMPGGYWVMSRLPVNWKSPYDGLNHTVKDLQGEQLAVERIAKKLCWSKVAENGTIAVWRKPKIICYVPKKLSS
ncbi:hypothetical protein GUJ93_ZPchr0007g4937 [Zizania palustris]|uniref:Methyltransferase n=1 Tax=Zizania palustris TaxID=103762 RepID=A0A8J5T3J3_ZIZPA|nr:hypothetical protein GUJ93_ZPchr0007g4937 [Zizania palustris]